MISISMLHKHMILNYKIILEKFTLLLKYLKKRNRKPINLLTFLQVFKHDSFFVKC